MSLNDPNWGRGSRGPQGPGGGNQGPPDLAGRSVVSGQAFLPPADW